MVILNKLSMPKWCERGKVRFCQLYGGPLELVKAITMSWEGLFKGLPDVIFRTINAYDLKLVDLVSKSHINVFHVVASQGHGIVTEKIQRKSLKPLIRKCHENGIRVIAYLDAQNIFWVSFYKERPEAEGWLERDAEGKPIRYGRSPWRYRACLNNPSWIEYQKENIKTVLAEGYDGLYFDNPYIDTKACYCSYCKEKFKKYTKQKLGIEHDLPREMDWRNPVCQAFIEFRYQTLLAGLRQYREYIKSLKPKKVFMFNREGPFTLGPATQLTDYASDPHKLFKLADLLYHECGETFPRVENGRIVGNIMQFKYGLAAGGGRNIVLKGYLPHYMKPTPGQLKLAIAEAASFCCSFNVYNFTAMQPPPMIIEDGPTLRALAKYNRFLQRNERYFTDVESIADIAVCYSRRTQDWYCHDKNENDYAHSRGFIQALIDSHKAFDIILEEDLCPSLLSKYRVLVLPNVACISRENINSIEGFVKNGGGLIATNETSQYDENYRKHEDGGLLRNFSEERGTNPLRKKLGEGRFVFFTDSPDKNYWVKGDEESFALLLDAIKWAMEREPCMTIEAPKTVFANLFRQSDRIVVHLVNYALDVKNDQPIVINDIPLRIRVPVQPKASFLLSPDMVRKKELRAVTTHIDDATYADISVPTLETYDIIVIKLNKRN